MISQILGGLSIIVVLYAIIFIIYRLFYYNGYKIKNIKINTQKSINFPSEQENWKIFIISFSFRLFMILLSIIIFAIFMNDNNSFSINDAINNWIKWDAKHYLNIAKGYSSYVENGMYPTLVFFPLYPFFIRMLSIFVNGTIAGLLVSNLFFSIASIYVYKLVSIDYNKKTALIVLVLLNAFPFSFFFSGIMSESTFLLFSTLTLYYIRKHKWLLVGLFGFLCALSRSMGIFIIIPAIVELIEEYKIIKNIKNIKYLLKILKKVLPMFAIVFGFLVYLYCNYRVTLDAFYFLKMEKVFWGQFYVPFYDFFQTVISTFNNFSTNFIFCVTIPQLIFVIFSYVLLFINVRKHRTMYIVWLLITIVVNTSISWPLSVCRYLTTSLPLYIFLADYLKKKQFLNLVFIVINCIFMIIFFITYLKGGNIY